MAQGMLVSAAVLVSGLLLSGGVLVAEHRWSDAADARAERQLELERELDESRQRQDAFLWCLGELLAAFDEGKPIVWNGLTGGSADIHLAQCQTFATQD